MVSVGHNGREGQGVPERKGNGLYLFVCTFTSQRGWVAALVASVFLQIISEIIEKVPQNVGCWETKTSSHISY